MSARVVWDELVRRYRRGELEVKVADLQVAHPYAAARITRMVRQGDVVRTRPGYCAVVASRLPPHVSLEVHA